MQKFVVATVVGLASVVVAAPKHSDKIKLGVCPANGYYAVEFNCPEFLTAPGVPAIDATKTKLALPWVDQVGPLTTLPNLTVQVLSAKDGTQLDQLVVWTQDEAYAFAKRMQDGKHHGDLAQLVAAIEARIAAVDPKLEGYTPMAACTHDDASATGLETLGHYCPGFDKWSCGSLTLAYGKGHTALAIKAGNATKTIDTKSWRRPAIEGHEGDRKFPIETLNCIQDVRAIPGTSRVAVELFHICDESGDWCGAGGPTWHVVGVD